MTTAAVAVVAGLVGLAVGSFLDVAAYRLPRGLSLLQPPSFCPSCDQPLAWFENVPVVSWLALRGRCRRCGGVIPTRALLVEACTAAGFVGVALAVAARAAVPGCCLALATVVALVDAAADDQPLPPAMAPVGTALAGVALVVAAVWAGWGHLVRAAGGAGAAGLAAMAVAVAAQRRRNVASAAPNGVQVDGAPVDGAPVDGAADGMAVALPAGALLGWLGALPAGAAVGAALVAGTAIMIASRGHVAGGAAPAATGAGHRRRRAADGRRAVTLAALVAVAVALVVAGTT